MRRDGLINHMKSKVTEKKYRNSTLIENHGTWRQRLLIGLPCTGNVRIEWVMARYGQVIPTNWSVADLIEPIPTYAPLRFLISDAENLIVKNFIEGNFEWLLSLEQDNVLPPNAFIKLNEYMIKKTIPIVSGLYFTKSEPPEPILYRGEGNGYFADWVMGDKVWVSGVPMGCTLIHGSILKAMWDESPEYQVHGITTRRVFEEPAKVWFDETQGAYVHEVGTSDLAWCKRIQKDNIFEKAGWKKYQKMKYPYLIDTSLFVKHIDENGRQFPVEVPNDFMMKVKREGKEIK